MPKVKGAVRDQRKEWWRSKEFCVPSIHATQNMLGKIVFRLHGCFWGG